jgi:hypothetical protein
MVIAETSPGLSTFKSMFDLAKSIKGMDDAIKRNEAVSEFWEQIFTAQTRYAAAVEQIKELEAKLASFEMWEAEKARYHLRDYGGGTFAYELKGDSPGGEPPHRICPSCYQQGKKGLLQSKGQNAWRQERVECSECDKRFELGQREDDNFSTRARAEYDPFGRT